MPLRAATARERSTFQESANDGLPQVTVPGQRAKDRRCPLSFVGVRLRGACVPIARVLAPGPNALRAGATHPSAARPG